MVIETKEKNPLGQSLPESSPKNTMREVKGSCREIGDKLCGFEDAWHMIRLACANLSENVEMAARVSVSLTWLHGCYR